MTSAADALSHLPAQPLDALFQELEARKADGPMLPQITVHLDSGHSFSGQFIQYQSDMIVMRTGDATSLDATYFARSTVRALTVHNRPETLPLLSFGELKPRPDRIPDRGEIDRLLQSVMEFVSRGLGQNIPARIEWDQMPASGETFVALEALISDLHQTLTGIGNDALSGPALLRIKQIAIGAGASPGVTRNGHALRIQVGVQGTRVTGFDRSTLQKAIETAL
ncbi:MAG: hypothetical protein ACYCW6_01520 [Candidatus Xenobia bacterium]